MNRKWLSELLELLYESESLQLKLPGRQIFSPRLEESFVNKVSCKVPSTEPVWERSLRQSTIIMNKRDV